MVRFARFLLSRLVGLAFLSSLLGGSPAGWAQAPNPLPPTWQPDPVLHNLLVQQLLPGPDGYAWVATDEGVRRYDGYAAVPLARLVRPGGAPAPGGYVSLAFDGVGQLWIAHNEGLACFAPRTGQLTPLPLPLAAGERPQVHACWHDARTGRLWLSYGRGRVLTLYPARPRLPRRPPPAAPGPAAIRLDPASGGAVWATSPAGIQVYDALGRARQRYPSPGCYVVPVPGTRPQQALSYHALFVVDSAAGRLREVRRWLPPPPSVDGRFYPAPDAAGRPASWLAGGRLWQLRWPPGALGAADAPAAALPTVASTPLAPAATTPGAYPSRVYALVADAAGPRWAFSAGFRGCYRQGPPPAVRELAVRPALANPSVRGLARLPDGRLLVSTYGGALTQAADSPLAPLRPWPLRYPAPGAEPPICYALLVSGAGRVLFANDARSFGELDPRTGRACDYAQLPDSAGAGPPAPARGHCLLQSRRGTIWGGGQGGLYQLDEARGWVQRYRGPGAQALGAADVHSLSEDAAGTLWLATDRGLYALNPTLGTLRHYGPTEASPTRRLPAADLVSALAPGVAGPLAWVATRSAGLLGIDPDRGLTRQLTPLQGLPDAPVATLLPGPDGAVWAGTYAGLVRYAPAQDQLAVYGPAEGLREAELNQQAALRDPVSGALYFGGVGGVCQVVRNAPAGPAPPPRLLFPALTHADSMVAWLPSGATPTLHLPGPAADAGLALALTNFSDPGQARFYYRLGPAEGPLGPVQRTGPQLRVRSPAAGSYTLAVWGQTASGQRSAVRYLALTVGRPWWQHPLAVGGGALLLLGLGAAVQWGRGRRQLREARLRTRIAADLHDEVGALLTRVSMRAELLHTAAPAEASPALGALLHDSRAAQATMRDLVWGIDAGADTVGALVDRLRDHLNHIAEAAGLRSQLSTQHLSDTQPLAPASRQHLYLLAKEAIANAGRHAHGATQLAVTLGRRGSSLCLCVTDDGRPATRPPGVGGLGLRSMQQRAQALGGQLTVGPRADGPGWEVCLVVDFRRLMSGTGGAASAAGPA